MMMLLTLCLRLASSSQQQRWRDDYLFHLHGLQQDPKPQMLMVNKMLECKVTSFAYALWVDFTLLQYERNVSILRHNVVRIVPRKLRRFIAWKSMGPKTLRSHDWSVWTLRTHIFRSEVSWVRSVLGPIRPRTLTATYNCHTPHTTASKPGRNRTLTLILTLP